MIDKTYKPSDIESRIYSKWESSGSFSVKLDGKKPTYTIMMPPPNVTGSLHMGHALNHTLQDILVRFHRMKGFDVLWQPGTDHAGIATQSVVEKQMDKEGLSRHDLGLDKFLNRVWEWKKHSGGTIVKQLKRLGVSPDWSRERFTMDEGLSKSVREVFVKLYNEKLIYRDKRLVNWDSQLNTAVSDIEVDNIETNGKMYYVRYPIDGEENSYIVIATTRPETMLGDTAVAVHPEDDRYKELIGKKIKLPLSNRLIPIISDEYCDPEKGTGAVKITPAHDFNDFEVGKRHNLDVINILNHHACINDAAPEKYRGLDRFVARKQIIKDLEDLNLFIEAKDTIHMVPHSERTGVVIEPYLTDQWFVDAKTLSIPAIEAVKSKKTCFVPKNWENTYFEWLNNIQPWCISRQLWWGHRIPAWFGPDGEFFVALDENEASILAEKHYGKSVKLSQDNDILDTWFSSALWPFSTLGWPDQTTALEKCYPGDVLITGHDIIFFWVARMMMFGLHFKKEIPFKEVCMTALVRDEHGQKMSKSKGNVVDPIEFIDIYGSDALRFSLASLAGPGRDINFSISQVEGYRNFATKIWNAFRFCQHNECNFNDKFDPLKVNHNINKWIILEVSKLSKNLEKDLKHYRFDEACSHLYQFTWACFCDWYIEFSKPLLQDGNEEIKSETKETTAWVFSQILHLIHPFMPYISEELWSSLSGKKDLLISSNLCDLSIIEENDFVEKEINKIISFITNLRFLRNQLNISPGKFLKISYESLSKTSIEHIDKYSLILQKIGRIDSFESIKTPKTSASLICEGESFNIDLEGILDIEKEKKRISNELKKVEKEINQINNKLSNKDFVAKAPKDVINKNVQRLDEAKSQEKEIKQAYNRLELI